MITTKTLIESTRPRDMIIKHTLTHSQTLKVHYCLTLSLKGLTDQHPIKIEALRKLEQLKRYERELIDFHKKIMYRFCEYGPFDEGENELPSDEEWTEYMRLIHQIAKFK
jgi:hypothetical protein